MHRRVCARGIIGRVLGQTTAAFCLWSAAGERAEAQDPARPAPAYETGLFEIRVGRLAAQTVVVQLDSAGRVLLPADAVFQLVGMPVERPHPDSARQVPLVTVQGQPDGVATLDLRSWTVSIAGASSPITRGGAAIVDGVLYLDSDVIEALLRAQVQLDFASLTAVLSRVPPFPVEQQVLADQRRGVRRRGRTERAALGDVPYRFPTGGVVLDWNASTAPLAAVDNSSLYLQLGAAIHGGSLTTGLNWFTAPRGVDNVAENWNYTWNTPRSRWVRQVQVGDQLGGGVQLQTLRGVSITNARAIRDGAFSEVPLQPDLPSGWSYEVYQDGQLLGFAESGTSEGVFIPLRYGSTPVQVRMIGPAGEEVLSNFRYQVPSSQLAPGVFEYSAGLGSCRELPCRRTTYARADWGAGSRLTVGGSAEWNAGDSTSGFDAAFRALALPARDWFATVELVPSARSQVVVTHETITGMNSTVSYARSEPGGAAVTSVVGSGARWFVDARHSRPLANEGLRAARLELHAEGFEGRWLDRVFLSTTIDGVRGSYGLRYERDPSLPAALFQLSHFSVLRRNAKGRFGFVPVMASVGITRKGLHRVESSVGVRTGSRGSLSVVARWAAQRRGATISLSYDALLGRARVSSRASAATRGQSSFVTSGGGAVAWSRELGEVFVDQAGTNLAGVGGRVFYDEDGSGAFSAGDRPAAGLSVIAGSHRARTGEDGRYRTWNILPYEVTSVSVDTLRDIAAEFIPLQHRQLLRPTPNMFNTVDFALVRTRELAGRLVAGEGIDVVGGVTINLVNRATGDTLRTVTFSDGEFYVSRVRPGEYELTVAPSSITALRALAPDPVPVIVSGKGADLLVEVPPITIRPLPEGASTGGTLPDSR